MIESLIADQWLVGVLNDATLLAAAPGGIHADVAPEGVSGSPTQQPWVVWFQVSGLDVPGTGTRRIMADLVYEVRATGRNATYAALKVAANRIDALLHGKQAVALADGTMIGCVRVEPVRFTEQDGEVIYRHLGGQYRIYAQGA